VLLRVHCSAQAAPRDGAEGQVRAPARFTAHSEPPCHAAHSQSAQPARPCSKLGPPPPSLPHLLLRTAPARGVHVVRTGAWMRAARSKGRGYAVHTHTRAHESRPRPRPPKPPTPTKAAHAHAHRSHPHPPKPPTPTLPSSCACCPPCAHR